MDLATLNSDSFYLNYINCSNQLSWGANPVTDPDNTNMPPNSAGSPPFYDLIVSELSNRNY